MKLFTTDNEKIIKLFTEEMFFALQVLIKFVDNLASNIVPIYI
jgi:hypothetical protein